MKQNFSNLFTTALLLFVHCFATLPSVTAKTYIEHFTDVYDLYNDCEDEWVRMEVEGTFRAVSNGGAIPSIFITTKGTGKGSKGNEYIYISNYRHDLGRIACGETGTSRFFAPLITRGKADNRLLEFTVTYATDTDCNVIPISFDEKIICRG